MYQNLLYKIVDKMYNLFLSEGFKQFTYGVKLDVNVVKSSPEFPSVRVVYGGASYNDQSTTLTYTIVVADKVDRTGNQYLEYSKNNSLDIHNDLLVKIQNVLKQMDKRYSTSYDAIQMGYEINYDITCTPFEEEYSDLLTGYIVGVSFDVPNLFDNVC